MCVVSITPHLTTATKSRTSTHQSTTTTRDTSFLTHVRSGSDYNTETTLNLILTTIIADVTAQETPSPKEPKHGRLFIDTTRAKHVHVCEV